MPRRCLSIHTHAHTHTLSHTHTLTHSLTHTLLETIYFCGGGLLEANVVLIQKSLCWHRIVKGLGFSEVISMLASFSKFPRALIGMMSRLKPS